MEHLFMMALLIVILPAKAQTISEQEARQIAENFYAQGGQAKSTGANTAATVSLAYQKEDALYVFNNKAENGFVIVSGHERAANPILGWSDKGAFDYETAPCGLKVLLELYTRGYEGTEVRGN